MCANSLAGLQPERSFATYRTKRRSIKVPVAFPSMESLITGRGVTFTTPNKEDKSAVVGFSAPPSGYRERTDQAQKYGVQNFYLNDYRDSVYTLFLDDAASTSQTLDEYVEEKKEKFRSKYPDSAIYPVSLNKVVTAHLDEQSVQHATSIFHQKSLSWAPSGQTSQSLPYMTFFLKTPGGFWRLNWYSQLDRLLKKNVTFCQAVKNLRVIMRESIQPVNGTKETKPPTVQT